MKPISKNKLIPQVQFTTQVELSDQQIATLNRLVLTSKKLGDDEALNLWQALNPFLPIFNHASPRDVFSSRRHLARVKN